MQVMFDHSTKASDATFVVGSIHDDPARMASAILRRITGSPKVLHVDGDAVRLTDYAFASAVEDSQIIGTYRTGVARDDIVDDLRSTIELRMRAVGMLSGDPEPVRPSRRLISKPG